MRDESSSLESTHILSTVKGGENNRHRSGLKSRIKTYPTSITEAKRKFDEEL